MSNNNLSLKNISGQYMQESGFVRQLEAIDLEARQQEVTIILGPSGSGKSALLSVIGLVSTPDAGTITLGDEILTEKNTKEKEAYRNEHIGYLYSTPNLISALNVKQNILFPVVLNAHISSELDERCDDLLIKIGLDDKAHQKVDSLSIAEQQLVALARALINKPTLLLADEPTAALDTTSGKEFLEFIRQFTYDQETTTIITTHDNRVEPFADNIYYIDEGKISTNLSLDTAQQHVLRELTEGIIVVNSENEINLMNHQAEAILGWKEIEVLDKDINSVLSMIDPQLQQQTTINELINLDSETTLQAKTKSGEPVYLSMTVTQTSPDVNAAQSLVTFRDITTEYLSKQQQSMFLHEITHYLRTPMTVIKGLTSELMHRDDLPSDTDISLISLKKESFRLETQIENLLLVATLQVDTSISSQKITLTNLVPDIVTSYQEEIEKHNVSIEINNSPEEISIKADKTKLRTALANLIENAIKYTHDGNVEINCNLKETEVEITISDTGKGIPQEKLDKVFDRFYYLSADLSTTDQGVGIGMFLAHRVIELHQGTISIDSKEGEGTTVTIMLPVDQDESN